MIAMKFRCFLLFVLSFTVFAVGARRTIDLSGEWQLSLPTGAPETVLLPGTMDTNGKGNTNDNYTETTQLSRKVSYSGPAYYSREVIIPKNWKDKDIRLTLERTRPSTVWVDGVRIGSQRFLSTPHVYDLSAVLVPGKHTLTVMVDNGDSIPDQIKISSHACVESTQTNWNGIVGKIELTAAPKCFIEHMVLEPDVDTRSFRVRAHLSEPFLRKKGKMTIWSGANLIELPVALGQDVVEGVLALGDTAQLWSEFNPARHRVNAMMQEDDTLSCYGALRKFGIKGHHFTINDTVTFLRGRHDACVFPLTGYAPMDVESWRRYFRIIKDYGLNHVRFHSWCPPEACFEAADIEGIYLQPELPVWGTFNEDEESLMNFLHNDGMAIQRAYGNHPSFAMFGLGNELWGDVKLMQRFTDDFKSVDRRHLYTYGSNAFLGWQDNLPGQEFWVTCRTGGGDGYSTHVRASFAFCDADEGGYMNNTYPNTRMNFEDAVQRSPVPVVGHETGQYQIYPDYSEMDKYTGVLEPRNFAEFRRRLDSAGMGSQARDFFNASGKWAVELYKADMEMNLRTPSMGGFQLLDLQDYPGQGSALVGILDAFMDSKGLVKPEVWRQSCDRVVVMAEFPGYCLKEGDVFNAALSVANYSGKGLAGRKLRWTLTDGDRTVAAGLCPLDDTVGYSRIGTIEASVPVAGNARKLRLDLEILGTGITNRYPLWAYPAITDDYSGNVLQTNTLNDSIVAAHLLAGGKVLLTPPYNPADSTTVGPLFQTDYWNYRMFKTICDNAGKPSSPGTMGILTDQKHPALASFPNDGHTDWQWYDIVKSSYPLILDRFNEENYLPLIQVIDNVDRNHRLGLLMEFAVDGGKVMLLMADPERLTTHVEGRQFMHSILEYMDSDAFMPSRSITTEELNQLLTVPTSKSQIQTLRNISYD